MTTNLQKIRQMNSEELAELLGDVCANCCTAEDCFSDCRIPIKQWLEQEVEE